MISRSTLLAVFLIEWEREAVRWKKARKRLKRAVKKAHKKVEKKVDKLERKGPQEGESPEDYAHRLLNKQEKLRKKIFKRRQASLGRLQSKEEKRFQQYSQAERKPAPIRPRKLKPVRARTNIARGA